MRHVPGCRGSLLLMVVIVTVASAGGCAHHRVVAQNGDPAQVPTEGVTHHQYFWGLVGEPSIYVDECPSHSLHDVEVSTSFWQGLATVVTLGIWMPATVEWRCATVPETTSDAPIPGVTLNEETPDAHR